MVVAPVVPVHRTVTLRVDGLDDRCAVSVALELE